MIRRGVGLVRAAATLAAVMMLLPAPVGASRQLIDPQRDPSRELAAGKILVAARTVADRNFGESVILLFSYSENGSAGLMVNRQTTVDVPRLLPDLPIPNGPMPVVFLGGPVALTDVRALVRSPTSLADAHRLLKDVFLLGTAAAIDREMQAGSEPGRLRLYAGYAGWAPGQLEREIQRGNWHVIGGDSGVAFDPNPDTLWRREIRLADVLAA